MRIVSLEEIKAELQRHIRNRSIFPIIGSGFSKGCPASGGNTCVPSGSQMKDYMVQYLKEHDCPLSDGLGFSRVARYYESIAIPEDYWKYFRDHFTSVQLSESRKAFLRANWKFVYTLNLDDAIESNSRYRTVVLPGKDLRLDALESLPCVFKLHGDAKEIVKYSGSNNAVLSITEYISSLSKSKSVLEKLAMDLNYSNALFVGCSLDDELDLLSVAQQLRERSGSSINRYYVTRKEPDKVQQIDLQDFGIDTVILAEDYEVFYDQFARIAKECECVGEDELERYHNYAISSVPASKNVDYLVSGRYLSDPKAHVICFPDFFVERDLEALVLREMSDSLFQIVRGSRISGKSYFLAGLVRKIKNKDVYYFDSRSHIDRRLLTLLFSKEDCVFLFDTNVLTRDAMRLLLDTDPNHFKQNRLNVVLCINNSDRDVLQIVHDHYVRSGSTAWIRDYELNKHLRYRTARDKVDIEGDLLNTKLKMLGITTFVKNQTILDNLISTQKYMRARTPTKFDSSISLSIDDAEKLSLLILLVMNEKVTAQELVRCGLMQKNAELLRELKTSIEEDHCKLLSSRTIDLVDYQVVCNAHVWLLEQLRTLSTKTAYDATFEEAFSLIIRSFLGGTKRFKLIEDYVKFDRLNEIFMNGKRLIQKIYDSLRPLLCESYQYYHQYAKCRSWGMDNVSYNIEELNKAKVAGLTALHMVEECNIDIDEIHRMAYAHILNTVSIIFAKLCFLEGFSVRETVSETSQFFERAILFPENYQAMIYAKNSKSRVREENGGVLRKWIAYIIENPSVVPYEAKDRVSKIAAYWGCL